MSIVYMCTNLVVVSDVAVVVPFYLRGTPNFANRDILFTVKVCLKSCEKCNLQILASFILLFFLVLFMMCVLVASLTTKVCIQ